MNRVRNGWLLAGVMAGGLALVGCTPKGTPVDTSAIGVAAVNGTRWAAHSAAWQGQNVSDWHSYDGIAYGPGSAYPTTRYTLRNPQPGAEYLPALDNPLYGAMAEEEKGKEPYRFPAIQVPSDDYYVNGVNTGPSVDRQQAGVPVIGR